MPRASTVVKLVLLGSAVFAKNAKKAKEVLLIITDGEDNASGTNLEETVRRIQDLQGPVVYSIGLLFDEGGGGGRESRRARRALQLLSDETGGLAFFPKNLAQVDEIAAEVARDKVLCDGAMQEHVRLLAERWISGRH